MKLPLKSVAAGWNATRPAEVASSGLKISISGRSGCSAVEVADLRLAERNFGWMHHDPANTPHFQPPSRIFNLLRQTSAELAQLQPNWGHSKGSSTFSAGFAIFRFSSPQANCFSASSAGSIPLQRAGRISSPPRAFTAELRFFRRNRFWNADTHAVTAS